MERRPPDPFTAPANPLLTPEECWELLRHHEFGRLAVDVDGRPDIFPVNYVIHGNALVFRTGAGTKLAAAVLGRWVAFEIDGVRPDERTAWSVVVKGWAREMTHANEVAAARRLPLRPWIAEPKPHFVRIVPRLVTGRRYEVDGRVDVGLAGARTTTTGDSARAATSALVEPSRSPRSALRPREPTTTRSASRDASTSATAAGAQATRRSIRTD